MSDRGLPSQDLDDVIELATRRAARRDDTLSMDEVKRIAAELDISEAEVEAAAAELRRRRQAERAAEGAERVQAVARRSTALRAAAAVGVVLALLVAWTPLSLGGKYTLVEQQRSAVANAIERQAAVQARYAGRDADRDADAELSGAENRVRIAEGHYDAAATAYNRAAGGLSGLFAGLFDYPDAVPLSADIDWAAGE